MKFYFLSVVIFFTARSAFAGSEVLFSFQGAPNQSNGYAASGSVTVDLNRYNASAVTIQVDVSGRYTAFAGFHGGSGARVTALAEIGSPAVASQTGSNVSFASASASARFTKSNGQWYFNGAPVGASVPAQASISFRQTYNDRMDTSLTISASWESSNPPTIAWTSSPGTVGDEEAYMISAHGHDPDGNLTAVSIWKNGQPFAFAGGGDGWDGDSGNPTWDSGPATVTFTAQASDADGNESEMISQTVTVNAPPVNQAPTISWNTTPGTVASAQSYTISAHGHDADGNLTQVNIWRNGSPYAFAGGGNGYDGDSGNPSTDTGPQTITYTANAVDSDGTASATISQTVTITAPPQNRAPSISWNTTPGVVASGESYTISAHGHDNDGNLTQVNVWRDSSPYAFAGGGNGYDGDSGNPSTDTGPQTITYTANAVDSNGATSAMISQTVTVTAANRAPVAAISGSTTLQVNEPGSWSFSASDADANLGRWRFHAATNGNPQWSAASGGYVSGSYSTSFATPGTYTWIVEAQDAAGAGDSASIRVTVTEPPVSGSIAATPTNATAPGSATISWSTANTTSVSVTGSGLNSSAASGSQAISGLPAGTHTYTLTAAGTPGPLTRTATVTITAPAPSVSGSIAANPTNATAPGSTTISWSTLNATSVSVTGNGLSSSAASGSRTMSGLPAGTHTYTLTAQGNGGPITRTATFTVAPAPMYALSTSATGGGSVTPGGNYPAGTTVTITANADATHRFTSWTGDASGGNPSIAITLDRNKAVQAVFASKAAQTISFAPPGDRAATSSPFTLNATASSGLPVAFTVLNGPATLSSGTVQLTGPGAVTIEASQPGDTFYLPAAPVSQTFNAVAPVTLKYHAASRTLLRDEHVGGTAPFVIGNQP